MASFEISCKAFHNREHGVNAVVHAKKTHKCNQRNKDSPFLFSFTRQWPEPYTARTHTLHKLDRIAPPWHVGTKSEYAINFICIYFISFSRFALNGDGVRQHWAGGMEETRVTWRAFTASEFKLISGLRNVRALSIFHPFWALFPFRCTANALDPVIIFIELLVETSGNWECVVSWQRGSGAEHRFIHLFLFFLFSTLINSNWNRNKSSHYLLVSVANAICNTHGKRHQMRRDRVQRIEVDKINCRIIYGVCEGNEWSVWYSRV